MNQKKCMSSKQEMGAIHKKASYRQKDCNATIFPDFYRKLFVTQLKKAIYL